MPGDPVATALPPPTRPSRGRRLLFRAPSPYVALGFAVVVSGILAFLAWFPQPGGIRLVEGFLLVFLVPALLAGALTGPLARALGGQLPVRRSLLLVLTGTALSVPLLAIDRALVLLPYFEGTSMVAVLLFLQGPTLWFRHMSLFGVSRPSHVRSILPSALQPGAATVGIFLLYSPTPLLVAAALTFLILGFLASVLLLRAADRPLRREFGVSGVSLIRPLLDHVNGREAQATASLEGFFRTFAIPADLEIRLLQFRGPTGPKATVVLPTVHPGPFASLGASDLPRKVAERMGTGAGTVLVPHTPCNHDLDLPTGEEVRAVADAAAALSASPDGPDPDRASPLVTPRPGSLARAQQIGGSVLVVVSQAPAATDDIDLAVADQIRRGAPEGAGLRLALVDAHNSYVEGQGDVTYGTPVAARLVADARAAVAAATAAAVPGPIEVGVASGPPFTVREHGIGPAGLRALVVRAAGTTTAYVLIDGNNLLLGLRAPILAGLAGVVDAAEVMTTDNHIVHEVDGGTNPVGERIPADDLVREVRRAVEAAKADLAPVRVHGGIVSVPAVPVLGPDFTARLLTSLGDTVSMFSNAFLMTFLLLLATSLVVLVAIA